MNRRTARLNVFQKTQRLWETIHPYNAAQAMELACDFSTEHVTDAFNAALGDLDLGQFVCEGSRYSVQPVRERIVVPSAEGGLESHLSREMNRPFEPARSMPFRPFDCRDDGRRYVGLTYQHWVADSVSIRMLMRQWVRRLTGSGGPCPVRLPSTGLLGAFGPATAGWSVIAQTCSLLGVASRMKSMRRVDNKIGTDVAVIVREGPTGLIDAVKLRARAAGATVGDVLLAAAAAVCATHGPSHPTGRREDLCMGTIVDLRARHAGRADNVFGLYLGFIMTAFPGGELDDFARLLMRTAASRRSSESRHAAEASQVNIALGYLIGRGLGPTRLREFYRKRLPLAGGLSSVNMTPGWAARHHPSPLAAYHRVSPTGPMLPLVLTPTTLGQTLRVCCTYRTALMGHDRATALVDAFFGRLARFADG